MKRAALLLAFAAALLLAWGLRGARAAFDERARGPLYVGLDDSESSYRLRAVELTLVTGFAPRADRFLDASGAGAAPWPPLVHSAVALVASRALERRARLEALAGFDERDLEELAGALGPVLALLAVAACSLAASGLAREHFRAPAALAAAWLYALNPAAIARESAPALHAHSWVVVFGCAQLATFAVALRARERVDVTVGALSSGVLAALAWLAGPECWPLPVAALGTLVALALRARGEARREAWGTVFLFGLGAAALLVVTDPGRSILRMLPQFGGVAGGLLASAPSTLACVALPFGLAWSATLRERADPLRATLLAAGFAAFACALFDRRFFAPLAVASSGLVATAVSGAPFASRAPLRRAALAVTAAALVVPLWLALEPRATPPRSDEAFVAGLRWMREHAPSSGAFNHPEAQQDWRVACPPDLAGSVAYHARRPVVGASFDGASTPGVATALGILASPDARELVQRLGAADAPFLVLTPRVLSDPRLSPSARAPGGLLAQLALPASDDALGRFPGLERVYASSAWETPLGREPREGEPCGPVISIWRCTLDARTPPSARPAVR